MRKLNVVVAHDAEQRLWYVDSSDIPGLHVEAPSFEELVDIVLDAAPDLIDCNIDETTDLPDIPVTIQHVAQIRRVHHDA